MAERIAIIGGGLMGHGIALVFACAGHHVRITDATADARARIPSRISGTLDELGRDHKAMANVEVVDTLQKCVSDADIVIEAVPENLELKQRIFAEAVDPTDTRVKTAIARALSDS